MTARFATAPIGPDLLAPSDGAGMLVTTAADALSLARIARSDVALDAGTAGAEFVFYGEAASVNARVGVVTPAASLAAALGADAGTIGWNLATGEVIGAGFVLASGLPTVDKGNIVGLLADFTAGTLAFFHGATQVASVAMSAGERHFAVSLASTEAGDLVCAVNAGQWQALSAAAQAGWSAPDAAISTVRLSDLDWLSTTTDAPANTRWEGVIDAAGITTLAELGFWAWGGNASMQGDAAQCRVMDPDGLLDALALGDASGVPVEMRQADADGSLASSTAVARFVLDRIEIEGDGHKRVLLRDAHDDLDLPLSRSQFLPNIPALAWRPMPVVIGAVASAPALLANSDGSVGFLADAPLAEVSTVMDRGDPMEAGTWSLDPNSQQLLLDSPPVGPVVADCSSIGAGMTPATLEQALRAVFGRIGKAAWSSADAAAIDTATGYAGLGYYAGDSVSVRQALAGILPSYGAWWWQDADGVLRFARVTDPDAAVSEDFDLDWAELGSDLVAVPDLAPNLTRRMAYRPNARPLSASELVTDLVDVPVWRRQELMGLWRGVAYGGGTLASRYRRADTAAPFVSVFWRAQDAQTEIDRVVGLYAVERRFYVWHVAGDATFSLQPGQIGRITYPRYGLDAGRNVLVRSRQRNPITGETIITFWGA